MNVETLVLPSGRKFSLLPHCHFMADEDYNSIPDTVYRTMLRIDFEDEENRKVFQDIAQATPESLPAEDCCVLLLMKRNGALYSFQSNIEAIQDALTKTIENVSASLTTLSELITLTQSRSSFVDIFRVMAVIPNMSITDEAVLRLHALAMTEWSELTIREWLQEQVNTRKVHVRDEEIGSKLN